MAIGEILDLKARANFALTKWHFARNIFRKLEIG